MRRHRCRIPFHSMKNSIVGNKCVNWTKCLLQATSANTTKKKTLICSSPSSNGAFCCCHQPNLPPKFRSFVFNYNKIEKKKNGKRRESERERERKREREKKANHKPLWFVL